MRVLVILAMACAAVFAADKSVEDRVQDLEKRLDASDRKNAELEDELDVLRARDRHALSVEIEAYLDQTERDAVPEASGIRTKKDALLTFYGFVRLDLNYNSARFNNAIVPVRVLSESDSHNNDEFAMDVRLTRVGMALNFGEVGQLKVTGKIEIDFLSFHSGVAESSATPRIRLAHIRLDSEKWFLELGQEWDVISPLIPNANTAATMLFAGNLGARRPMVRWFYKPNETFTLDTALGLTGSIDNQDLDGDGQRDGMDAGLPHFQIRAAVNTLFKQERGETDRAPWMAEKVVIGVWGFVGALEASDGLNGESDFTSWAGGVDFTVPLGRVVFLRGEAWYGQALSDVGGTGGSSINTATGEEVRGYGGWFEVVMVPNMGWQFYVGGSIDDPRDGDVQTERVTKNWTGYAGVRRHWTTKFRTTFDVIYWETQYKDDPLGNAVRINVWVSYDF